MDDPVLEFSILETVHANDGNLTQRHISQKLGRSLASVNFALRLLAVKGYIKITGRNHRNLRYHLTPQGIMQKSILAYDFLKRQSSLYEEVRQDLLGKLQNLANDGTRRVALYGWTPFTEAALLYLISEGIEVAALYVDNAAGTGPCSRVAFRALEDFQEDCQVLVLMEPLPPGWAGRTSVPSLACYPMPWRLPFSG